VELHLYNTWITNRKIRWNFLDSGWKYEYWKKIFSRSRTLKQQDLLLVENTGVPVANNTEEFNSPGFTIKTLTTT
jgi:hypothetical protein